MYNICVFGGTTEGRELVEFLSAQPCNVTACVVTDYAQSLLPASGHVTVSAKKLPAGEIAAMLLSQRFDLVVDHQKHRARLPRNRHAVCTASAQALCRFPRCFVF